MIVGNRVPNSSGMDFCREVCIEGCVAGFWGFIGSRTMYQEAIEKYRRSGRKWDVFLFRYIRIIAVNQFLIMPYNVTPLLQTRFMATRKYFEATVDEGCFSEGNTYRNQEWGIYRPVC